MKVLLNKLLVSAIFSAGSLGVVYADQCPVPGQPVQTGVFVGQFVRAGVSFHVALAEYVGAGYQIKCAYATPEGLIAVESAPSFPAFLLNGEGPWFGSTQKAVCNNPGSEGCVFQVSKSLPGLTIDGLTIDG